MLYVVNAGGGQLPSILINTDTGATVTISKDGTSRELVATNGTALFEDVEYGTWNVSSSLGGATTTDTIEVVNEFGLTLSVGKKLSSMPLKTTKLKIGGIKWILFARDHAGYPSGAQTLLMEYANSSLYMSFGAAAGYGNSNVRTSASDIYQGFSDKEKAATLLTERNYRQTSSYYSTNEYTFPLNSAEVGFENDANMGSNIGFNTATEKIYYIENGNACSWWLADVFPYAAGTSYTVSISGNPLSARPSGMSYLRVGCNLSVDTIITSEPDDEGYYFIKGAEETTELLLSRALNALSILGVEQ